jgi:hypothetical protein
VYLLRRSRSIVISVAYLPSCPLGVVYSGFAYPDGAIVIHTRQDRQVPLPVPTAILVGLPSGAVGSEPPEVGEADELLAIHDPRVGQMGPLVRATGLRDARDSRPAPPHHQILASEAGLHDAAGWDLYVEEADPAGTGLSIVGPADHGSDVREARDRHR